MDLKFLYEMRISPHSCGLKFNEVANISKIYLSGQNGDNVN